MPSPRAARRRPAMELAMAVVGALPDELTLCIKHTSRFERRRVMLRALMVSIRQQLGYIVRVLVADDGGLADPSHLLGAELIALPSAAGLSACLLYTSPSPRDGLLSRMPSSA